MSEAFKGGKRLSSKDEIHMKPYKTILNTRDLSESKTFKKDFKPSNMIEKHTSGINLPSQEKKISSIIGAQGNSRSSSAIRKKRGSTSMVNK